MPYMQSELEASVAADPWLLGGGSWQPQEAPAEPGGGRLFKWLWPDIVQCTGTQTVTVMQNFEWDDSTQQCWRNHVDCTQVSVPDGSGGCIWDTTGCTENTTHYSHFEEGCPEGLAG